MSRPSGDGYRFTGGPDRFLMGVPARDLSPADVAGLTEEQRALLEAHLDGPDAVYEVIPAPPATPGPAPKSRKEAAADG